MLGFPPEAELYWSNEVRVWATILAIVAAVVAVAASYLQINLQEQAAAARDQAHRRLQAESQERIAQAQADATRAEERAKELAREAEQVRLERERLLIRFAWRRIDSEQRRQIADALRPTNLRPVIFVTTSDPEAAQFRADLVAALRDAGDPNPIWRVAVGSSSFEGLSVQGPKEEERLLLVRLFEQAGFPMQNGGQAERLTIVIGAKPPPF